MNEGTMMQHIGLVFTELGENFLRCTMPVSERTCQPMRILHGGASVVLAETLASAAAFCIIDINKYICVGQEINANHLRSAALGTIVEGTTRPFHIGSRSHVWGIKIVNERKELVCVSRITLAVINRPTKL